MGVTKTTTPKKFGNWLRSEKKRHFRKIYSLPKLLLYGPLICSKKIRTEKKDLKRPKF